MRYIFHIVFLCIFLLSCTRGGQSVSEDDMFISQLDSAISKYMNDSIYYTNWVYPVEKNIWTGTFKGESGYLKKLDALELIKLAGGNGVIRSESSYIDFTRWDEVKESEVMAKYYKDKHVGRYMVYVDNKACPFPDNMVLQVDIINKTIDRKTFPSGNYNCCWQGQFDGFKKVGEYYYIRPCGTGSGYCAADIHLFRDLKKVPENPIAEYAWSSGFGDFPYLWLTTTEMELTLDGVKFKYKYEEGEIVDVDTTTSVLKAIKTLRFTIDYILVDNRWTAKDSTMLKAINLPF